MIMKHASCFARLSGVLLLLLVSVCAFAQQTVSGTVLDKETNEPIIGAAVVVEGTTNGTVTDFDGAFSLKVEKLPANLVVSFLGYSNLSVNATSPKLGKIMLGADSKALEEVVVKSAIAVDRKTPVALTSIAPEVLEEKIGTKDLPEVLRSTPSVYVSNAGGGYGDTEVLMRGFKSANIAVMVNGVPVNDMEWGGVYQSNWQGLGDVIRTIQTQRGLGASKISAPSVGGTISYITRGLDTKRGGSISYAIGSDNYNKIMATVSSGMNEKGWAFNLSLAKTWGDGYFQGTDFEGYNWFFNVAKRINANHQLSFTALGAPQWHNQRNSANGLTLAQWQKVKDYMGGDSEYKYNPVYGFDKDGNVRTSNRNVYNKPQLSLNHQWQIDDKQSLSSALYMSIGRGYGLSGQASGLHSTYSSYSAWYGASSGSLNTTFRHADGTFGYDMIQDVNEQSETGSALAMSISKNYHTWIGLISSYDNKINDNLEVSGGIDFRWYKGQHTNELIDLYNGEYFIDYSSRKSVSSSNNIAAVSDSYKYEKLHVGDIVYRDYDGYTINGGIFAQVEYTKEKLTAYVSGSVSNTTYWRYDRFYYDESHAKSETVDFWGFTAKGGVNFNLNEYNNVFANTGFISRAPFFSGGAFLSSSVSNATNPDAVNEKCYSVEVGYGFHKSFIDAKFNAYYTKWMDQTMARSSDYSNTTTGESGRYTINLSGVDARHMGLEFEATVKPAYWVEVNAMLSIGNWVDDCETTGYYYDQNGQPMTKDLKSIASGIQAADHARITLILDKTRVGEAAQTTAAVGVKFKPMKGLRLGLDYNLAAKHYADWSIKASDMTAGDATNGDERGYVLTYGNPWEIPASHVFDLNAGYTFDFGKLSANLSGNINNLFDVEYIQNGDDGSNHDAATFYGFYGKGRTYSVKMKINF